MEAGLSKTMGHGDLTLHLLSRLHVEVLLLESAQACVVVLDQRSLPTIASLRGTMSKCTPLVVKFLLVLN
jgi:hypothetical protein